MPEWLELELTRHLAPVEAPRSLTWRPPVPKTSRWSFTLAPILGLAAAVAVVILATVPGTTNPAAVNRLLAQAGIRLPIPPSTPARLENARVLGSKGAPIATVTYRVGGTESTILIARASTVRGPNWKPHGQTYAIAYAEPHTACVLCHANL